MKKDPRVYLLHIRDAVDCIAQYTVDGKEQFFRDGKTQDAVIYKLAVVGEAVKRLPRSLRDEEPAVPWKKIAGMRDIVIHDYDSTELGKVWKVVERDLPRLQDAVQRMLDRTEDEKQERERAA